MVKYISIENTSTMVEIIGEARSAGSRLIRFAAIGSIHPNILEAITVNIKESDITDASVIS